MTLPRAQSCFVCHQRLDGSKDERVWAIEVSPERDRLLTIPLRAHEECLPDSMRDILELNSR